MTKTAVTIVETPHKRQLLERERRYEIRLHGQFYSDLFFNIKGYVGGLPLPSGRQLDIGEVSLTAYRKEVAQLNREWAAHA